MPQYLNEHFAVRMAYVQAWIAGLTLLLTTLLAMALLGAWPGLALGALVALSPHQSVYVPYLLSETTFGAVLMLALAAGVAALRTASRRARYVLGFLSGVLFGMACLVRPTLNQWIPVLLILLLVPAVRRFWREVAVLALGFVLMMSPWWVRNEITLHHMTDSEKMLVTVQQGSYVDLMYQGRPDTYGAAYRFDPKAAQAASSWPDLMTDLRDKFASQPAAMVRWYVFGKVESFLSWSSAEGWGDIFTYPVFRTPWLSAPAFIAAASLMRGMHAPLMILSVLGALMAFLPVTRRQFDERSADAWRFLALMYLFAIGVHVVGLPIARYSVPFQPLGYLFAGFQLVLLYRFYRERQRQELSGEAQHA
ncbi:hypothetical protein DVT68_06005 [Dyella solisilvae]|uniref:Glycosyltransferase RgtA/B/C/D-like domain-containing protein n=2 Tax=Dyella solisilvae TaxID=1920168 RepID=A0A370KCP4_9GAMM|nr:hypothetical protein DVT68_06005 [Dyella solisilvae]